MAGVQSTCLVRIFENVQCVPSLKFMKTEWETSWLIFTQEDNEQINIGIIDNVDEANKALVSLRKAIVGDLG